MSGRYPFLVDVVWRVVRQLSRDWQQAPYRWEREADLQVALASRLGATMRLIGEGSVVGSYQPQSQRSMGRVACEPKLYLDKKRRQYCFPDVVVWRELEDESDPPDRDAAWRGNWPVLWACEIKVDHKKGAPSKDEEKLIKLVTSKAVDFGLVLDVRREKGKSVWAPKMLDGKLWRHELRLPLD